ncbi:MAG: MoaD/ThiS family protein [Oscillospiraceae bacterium]|nr:MoaD/ThiS family protein [Oscillospiraceae bacterium]
MQINVRFVCREIVGAARSGVYTLGEQGTVSELMDSAAAENGSFIPDYARFVVYLVNDRPAAEQTMLKEGDRLTVLRKAHGG